MSVVVDDEQASASDLEEGHVECAAAYVVDDEVPVFKVTLIAVSRRNGDEYTKGRKSDSS